MGKTYQVVVHGVGGQKVVIELCTTEQEFNTFTVLQLKDKIAKRLPESAGQDSMRLIFADKALDRDSSLLNSYGVQHMSVIFIVLQLPGGLTA